MAAPPPAVVLWTLSLAASAHNWASKEMLEHSSDSVYGQDLDTMMFGSPGLGISPTQAAGQVSPRSIPPVGYK